MAPSDSLAQFGHQNPRLAQRILELAKAVQRLQSYARPSVEDARSFSAVLDALQDELLRSFQRREKALFPYVVAQAPSLHGAVESLVAAHDVICSTLSHLALLVSEPEGLAQHPWAIVALFGQFESIYVRHSREEAALLDGLRGMLDEKQQARLAEIVSAL